MLRVNSQKVTGVDYSKVNYSVESLNFAYLCNCQPESHRVFSIGFGMEKLTTLMFVVLDLVTFLSFPVDFKVMPKTTLIEYLRLWGHQVQSI